MESTKKSLIGLVACTTLSFITMPNDSDSPSKPKSEKINSKRAEKSSKLRSSSQKSSSSESSSSAISSALSKQNSSVQDSSIDTTISSTIADNETDNNQTENDGMDHTAQAGKVIGDVKTHIYHTADQHNYKIKPKNEVVFSNEQDAINAGYRKALR